MPIGFKAEIIPQQNEKKTKLYFFFKSNTKHIAKLIKLKNKTSVKIVFEKDV